MAKPADNNHRGMRRDQIRDTAEQLFRERGYMATSIRDIADVLQIKGGSLYAHISGKEDLLWEIGMEAATAFFAALEPILAKDLPPVDKLREAITAHIGVIAKHLGASAVYFDEWRHLAEVRRMEFLAYRDRYERLFQQLIHEGISAGVFDVADERLATRYVLGSLNAIRHWYKPEGRLSAAEIAAGVGDMIIEGLRRRSGG